MGYNECNGEDSRLREKTHTGADVEGSPDPLLLFNKPPTNEPPKKKLEMRSSICFSSRHVPLLLAVSIIISLIIVIVGLAVSFHTGFTKPCPVCQTCGYSAPCEEDWIWYRGKCYYFSETYDEWNNSQNFCASHNASLSLIDSQEELDFLRRHKGLYDHWIGLYRDIDGPAWVWANGSLFRNT
ncbi:hypothetical protein XELAEV_18034309mg [Xenopus laevis]|nr:hypothetical protein XELAEV_18034309mg [Xenopus laevis]